MEQVEYQPTQDRQLDGGGSHRVNIDYHQKAHMDLAMDPSPLLDASREHVFHLHLKRQKEDI